MKLAGLSHPKVRQSFIVEILSAEWASFPRNQK